MNSIFVWNFANKLSAQMPVLCGELELVDGRKCRFRYDDEWLVHQHAYALSPDLPLRGGWQEPFDREEIAPVFEDAGPDRWGKRIIDKIYARNRRSMIDYLLLGGENRIGALGFSESRELWPPPDAQLFYCDDLNHLLEAARALENKQEVDSRIRQLLAPGASIGGARPKAIIEHEGRSWIAKFPAAGDDVNVCRLEHACLRLAERCGIEVPESRIVSVNGSDVVLVARFDRDGGGRRLHLASARTLLLAEGIKEGDFSYAGIAEIARKYSPTPKSDCLQVFRRMAFNVLMDNTDDHERNHAFLHKDGVWKLSPAYDIQPQLLGVNYQQLIVGRAGTEPSLANVLSECGRFQLSDDEARQEISAMLDVSKEWRSEFRNAGVSDADIAECERYIRVDAEGDVIKSAALVSSLPAPRPRTIGNFSETTK